jgi:biopolymer transport protein ExbD
MAMVGGKAGDVFTEINVTPLTDVFLVLLVIMILIAPLVNQTVLKVDPPAPPSNQKPKQPDKGPVINVEVTGQNVIKVNGQIANPANSLGVMKLLQAEQQKAGKQDIPLNLSSDGDALQKYVVYVMDAAAGCNIKQMRVLPIKNR